MTTLAELPAEKKSGKPSTAHLKVVPETRELRDQVRDAAVDFAKSIDRSKPLTKPEAAAAGRGFPRSLGLGEQYLGFAMVAICNEFWRDQVAAIDVQSPAAAVAALPEKRRGLPRRLRRVRPRLPQVRRLLGGRLQDARPKSWATRCWSREGTPIVLKIIVSGHVDAIVGVACLNVLEKAIDKILLAGIPCVAAPLLSSNCRSTSVDDDWVSKMIELKTEPPAVKTRTYMHLMRSAVNMFEEMELNRLAPRSRKSANGSPDPLERHETIAYEWLAQGGKRSRPFITLAAYDALKGGAGTLSADDLNAPDSVKRTALAIETFHKASLVHDDIEDDDTFRYGRETLHRQYGVGTAINVGDYLIGLGYRLVSRDRKELGGDVAADILDKLADAHLKLSEGQGAELLWRDAADNR